VAEVIIGKRRNQSTNVVKLVPLGEYTKFQSFAAPASH